MHSCNWEGGGVATEWFELYVLVQCTYTSIFTREHKVEIQAQRRNSLKFHFIEPLHLLFRDRLGFYAEILIIFFYVGMTHLMSKLVNCFEIFFLQMLRHSPTRHE